MILLDLSHSVDVVWHNRHGLENVDVIQCSIDAPPLKPGSIDRIVFCHNVIQHTPSVEKTAHALWALTAKGGEFISNCYCLNDTTPLRWVRHHQIYRLLRAVLSRTPFGGIMAYAWTIALLRLAPVFGILIEKVGLCVHGHLPIVQGGVHGFGSSGGSRMPSLILLTYTGLMPISITRGTAKFVLWYGHFSRIEARCKHE